MYIDINNLLNEIYQMITKLKNAKSESEQIKIYIDLINLCETYDVLTDYEYEVNYFNLTNNKLFKNIHNSNVNNNIFFNNIFNNIMSKNLLKIYRDSNFKSLNNPNPNVFNMSETIDIIFYFFNKYNYKYYKLVKNMINNNQVAIKTVNNNLKGVCYNIPILKKSYIVCNIRSYNISEISALVHEFGHAIYFSEINNDPSERLRDKYIEVPSMYFMKLFLDYCSENNLNNKGTILAYNYYYRRLLNRFAGIRYTSGHIINKKTLNYRYNINYNTLPKDIIIALSQCNSKGIDLDINNNIIYAYGSLIAIYLSDQYKFDPNETKNNFINIISKIGKSNNQDILNICGLNQKELVNPKILKKELKNHIIK